MASHVPRELPVTEREARAYHEAAHVAMRLYFGIAVSIATIDGVAETGGRSGVWGTPTRSPALEAWLGTPVLPPPPEITSEIEHLVISFMAGEIAQYTHTGEHHPYPHMGMTGPAFVHGDDVATWRWLVARLEATPAGVAQREAELEATTRQLVNRADFYALIKSIAAALLDEGTIYAKRIEQIASEHPLS